MGIMQIIRNQKQQFRRLQQDRSEAHNVAAAEELKALKEKRMKLEGKARIAKLQANERSSIQQSRQTLREQSPGRRFGKNLAKFINEGKTQLKKVKGSSSGQGIQLGGSGFNADGGSSPFGSQKKEKPKQQVWG